MNAEQIRYMHAMGIQPWQLNNTQTQSLSTRLMVITETPFIGRADQLFNAMLESIGLDRSAVHVVDLQSSPHLITQQIASVNPGLLLAAGQIAANFLLDAQTPLEQLRGKMHAYGALKTPVVITCHPDHLLLHPTDKRKAFQDLQQARIFITA